VAPFGRLHSLWIQANLLSWKLRINQHLSFNRCWKASFSEEISSKVWTKKSLQTRPKLHDIGSGSSDNEFLAVNWWCKFDITQQSPQNIALVQLHTFAIDCTGLGSTAVIILRNALQNICRCVFQLVRATEKPPLQLRFQDPENKKD
jgi:hypothetical protein